MTLIYTYICYHQITLTAWSYLSLSWHPCQSSIACDRSSRLHPVSTQNWWMYVFARQPTLAHHCVGVSRKTSLISFSWLLQQCPKCLAHLTWMVCKMGGWWPYKCYFVGYFFQDLFNTACNILVQFLSSLFSMSFFIIHHVHPFSSMDTATALKKSSFILVDNSDFCMINNVSISFHIFAKHMFDITYNRWDVTAMTYICMYIILFLITKVQLSYVWSLFQVV